MYCITIIQYVCGEKNNILPLISEKWRYMQKLTGMRCKNEWTDKGALVSLSTCVAGYNKISSW